MSDRLRLAMPRDPRGANIALHDVEHPGGAAFTKTPEPVRPESVGHNAHRAPRESTCSISAADGLLSSPGRLTRGVAGARMPLAAFSSP